MNRIIKILIYFIFISLAAINSFAQFGNEEELVTIKLYKSFDRAHRGSELKIALMAEIQKPWHINSNNPNEEFLIATALELPSESPFRFEKIIYPEAENLMFSFSDQPVSVFEGKITVAALILIPAEIELGTHEIQLYFTYQACNDVSCLAPYTAERKLQLEIVDNQTSVSEINSDIFENLDLSYARTDQEEDESLAGKLESSGLFISLIFIFLGGLALNLTPCVYPLIPITIGYFGGQSEGRTSKLFLLGILYVIGISITYSVVGVVTSLSGAVFGTLLQNPIVILFIVAVFIALSLSMFGLYEFKLPDKWVMKAGGAKSGAFGAFFMGLTMGIVAAPCIGPFVIGLVTYVAAKGDPLYGFLMFFVLALGLGFPYLILALFSGKIKNLPRAGFWMEAIKHIFGLILLGMALYFLLPLLPSGIQSYVLPVFMLGAVIYLIFFDKVANDIKGFRIFKTAFSAVVLVLAVYMLWPVDRKSPDWQYFSEDRYEAALANNEKMIIDFYADWCIPCKELDALTFSDPRVIERSREFTAFKVDMTKSMSEETERIRKKFDIRGMPTVLVINSGGKEEKRLTGFVGADEFLDIISGIN